MSEILTERDCWLLSGGGYDQIPILDGGQGREPEELADGMLTLAAAVAFLAGILLARAGWEAWMGFGMAISGLAVGIASLFVWPVPV